MPGFSYYRRIFSAYLLGGKSHLTFWHETAAENPDASAIELGPYYMLFSEKADYSGPFDADGIPQLDYHGHIGVQYNPIAIAQYGLGNYNLWRIHGDPARRDKFFRTAVWLCEHLEINSRGLAVWAHHFNWEYRDTLQAPWYSGLAQGQGISVLVRAHKESSNSLYLDAAQRASRAFNARSPKVESLSPTNPATSGLRNTSSLPPPIFSTVSSGRFGAFTITSLPQPTTPRGNSFVEE